jgi:quinol monooxygenase YgiN
MSVLVQFVVTVPDKERFKKAWEEDLPNGQKAGSRNDRLYWDENEPNRVTMMSEWDSHDQMHAYSEEAGEAFNQKAGTEGLDWDTYIWHAFE